MEVPSHSHAMRATRSAVDSSPNSHSSTRPASSRGPGFVEESEQVTQAGIPNLVCASRGSNRLGDLGENVFERLGCRLDLRSLLHQIGSDFRRRHLVWWRNIRGLMSRICRRLLSRSRIDIPEKALERRLVLRNKLADQVPGSLEVPTTDYNLFPDQSAVKAVVFVLVSRSTFRGRFVRALAFLRQHLRNALFGRLDRPALFGSPLRQFGPGVQVFDPTQISNVSLPDVVL